MSATNQHLVFITSLATGDAGAITAYKLDTTTGALELSQRNTDVENPFFIALSPDRKFLYSVHLPGDFESDPGAIAAFEIVDDAGTCRAVVAVLRRLDEAAERRPLVAIGMPDRAEHVDGS